MAGVSVGEALALDWVMGLFGGFGEWCISVVTLSKTLTGLLCST